MAKTIDEILNEADMFLATTQKASQEKSAAQAPSVDEVTSLAQMLMDPQPQQAKTAGTLEYTLTEKVAAAVALIDTLNHLEQMSKLAHFEELARSKGISEEKIQEFVEKQAEHSVGKYVLPAALLASGAGGAYLGNKAGKKKGYDQAMNDVAEAFGQ